MINKINNIFPDRSVGFECKYKFQADIDHWISSVTLFSVVN